MSNQKNESEKVKITMLVKESTRKAWKQYGLDTDRTLTDVIKDAMQEYIKNHPAN